MAGELTSWNAYLKKLDGRKPNAKLATFHARYKFAYNFEGMQINGMAENTKNLYYLVTKVGFAYSALENLEVSLRTGHASPIIAPDLALYVRSSMPRALDQIQKKMYLNESLRNRLVLFFDDPSASDVRPIVEQFRHSLFHGKFTPTGWGLSSGYRSTELLEGLSQVTLRHADQTFTKWFKQQTKSGLQQT